jgi:putative oxidoreductase
MIIATKFMHVEKAFEIAGGLLLVLNRYVLIALSILALIVFNIVLFHLLLERYTLMMGLIPFLLWLILVLRHRHDFAPLLLRQSESRR